MISEMAEVAVPKRLFPAILGWIRRLRMPETVLGRWRGMIRPREEAEAIGLSARIGNGCPYGGSLWVASWPGNGLMHAPPS